MGLNAFNMVHKFWKCSDQVSHFDFLCLKLVFERRELLFLVDLIELERLFYGRICNGFHRFEGRLLALNGCF